VTDPDIEKTLRKFLEDASLRYNPVPNPAFTQSRKGLGYIMVFLKHLIEFTKKRNDIENVEAYHKNGVFEELCHLVEHKGDSGVHPASYGTLWNLYRRANLLKFGNPIISQLDTDRNHYEVYLMMIKAYPEEWVERYCRYFKDEYERIFQQWKTKVPSNITHARLVTDTLRSTNFMYVTQKVPKERLSDKNKKLLDLLTKAGKLDIESKKGLIEKNMGSGGLTLIDSLDESIFKTPVIFFSVILDLWKSLHLV